MLLSMFNRLLPLATDFYHLEGGDSNSKLVENTKGVMGGLFQSAYRVAGVFFVLALLMGILSYMLATVFGGNRNESKERIINVFVGIAITCGAITLVSLVMGIGASMR